jgi:hypothetical protein
MTGNSSVTSSQSVQSTDGPSVAIGVGDAVRDAVGEGDAVGESDAVGEGVGEPTGSTHTCTRVPNGIFPARTSRTTGDDPGEGKSYRPYGARAPGGQ